MTSTLEIPVWLAVLVGTLGIAGLVDRIVGPSLRWFFRRRVNRAIDDLNDRLDLKIQPFKLTRRKVLVDRLIYDPEVMAALEDHVREEGVPRDVAMERVERYARETVPAFSAFAYFSFGARIARWISQALFRVRLGYIDDAALAAMDPEATVVFVMNHRSNMDYLLVTYLAAQRSALSYAVGEWARRWPLRPLIRSMGGYFVRRRDLNPLYRKVLARYVKIATQAGVTQAVFPEGRLSRDGALHPPKLGILSYVAGDHDAQAERDVVFVPVALNYERVIEDRTLIAATEEPGQFRLRWYQVVKYLVRHLQLRVTGRFRRFGYAAVAYGEPLSLHAFAASCGADPTEALAAELMARIEAVLPVLPLPLVAEALERGATSIPQVARHLEDRAAALSPTSHPFHHASRDAEAVALIALRMLEVRGILQLSNGTIAIRDDRRALLAFYRRTLPARASIET
mgnify:CR=1 FL=1